MSWTAPTGGGTCGQAALYDLRWSVNPITSGNFASAQAVGTSSPKAPGATENAQLNGLPTCTTRYFALKIKDVAGNWSDIATTQGTSSCGGCCMDPLTAGGTEELRERVVDGEGASTGSSAATLATETEATLARGFVFERLEGEGTIVRIRAMSLEEARGHGADTTGALFLGISSEGGPPSLARITDLNGQVGVSTSLRTDRRIIGLGSVVVLRVESSIRSGESSVASVSGALHSRSGDVSTAVRDSGRVELSPGDTLVVQYSADTSQAVAGVMTGHFVVIDLGSPPRRKTLEEEKVSDRPLVFALHQNRPHPFASTTTFQFDLPRAEQVTLDVLDVQGRRVALVTSGRYPAGSHSVTWEGRSGGGRAAAGVYFYRIAAGSFHAQRKLVVLP